MGLKHHSIGALEAVLAQQAWWHYLQWLLLWMGHSVFILFGLDIEMCQNYSFPFSYLGILASLFGIFFILLAKIQRTMQLFMWAQEGFGYWQTYYDIILWHIMWQASLDTVRMSTAVFHGHQTLKQTQCYLEMPKLAL